MKRERLRRYRFLALSLIFILAIWWGLGWAQGQKQWGPFRAQIVDEETGQPIEGAAILAVWWMDIPMFVQDIQVFDAAREAVTDAEGRLKVPGRWPSLLWLLIRKPQFHYFAPGYVPHTAVTTPPEGRSFIDPTIINMRRLKTTEERRDYVSGRLPGGIPHEKMPHFIRALNKELSTLGLGTYSVGDKE